MAKKKITSKHGLQIKAGQLLSQFLRKIAQEETELVTTDGEDKMATKAEAMARLMWRMALGYTEEKMQTNGIKEIIHPPDRAMIGLLFDRIEGRAPLMTETGKKRTIADKVSEQGKKRIAKAGGLDAAK